jgi:hypothetical protein
VSNNPTTGPSKQPPRSVGVKQVAHVVGITPYSMRRWLRRHGVRRRGLIWLWSEDEAAKVVARYRSNGGTVSA